MIACTSLVFLVSLLVPASAIRGGVFHVEGIEDWADPKDSLAALHEGYEFMAIASSMSLSMPYTTDPPAAPVSSYAPRSPFENDNTVSDEPTTPPENNDDADQEDKSAALPVEGAKSITTDGGEPSSKSSLSKGHGILIGVMVAAVASAVAALAVNQYRKSHDPSEVVPGENNDLAAEDPSEDGQEAHRVARLQNGGFHNIEI